VDRRSAVGSGDSLVAGLAIALAEGLPLEDGLRLGTAAGAATARTVGTHLGERADIEALLPDVRVERV
jgi:fructose-1-phosphate kinase PfkB-like protein